MTTRGNVDHKRIDRQGYLLIHPQANGSRQREYIGTISPTGTYADMHVATAQVATCPFLLICRFAPYPCPLIPLIPFAPCKSI